MLDLTLQNLGSDGREVLEDCLSRCQVGGRLLMDDSPGLLQTLVGSTYPGQPVH